MAISAGLVLLVAFLALPGMASGQSPAAPPARAEAIPQAVIDQWARLVGTWVTDNSAYKSDDNPYDGFGLEWSWGLGERSLVGRLYGIVDGRDVATFWEFREFWHPGDARLVAMQFGAGGAVGSGWHDIGEGGTSEMLQTFYYPAAGTVEQVGHRSTLEGDRHVTASFSVAADGTWTPRRTYTWYRQPGG